MSEIISNGGTAATPAAGTAGLNTQLPGQAATVGNVASATGGINPGALIETAIDKQLFQFESDENPLMQLMLSAKTVKVDSPVIQHFAIDQQRSSVTTTAAVGDGNTPQVVLPLAGSDQNLLTPYTTVLAKGVNGYNTDGTAATPGRDLMLFVSGRDATTNNPIVRAVNGPKDAATDDACKVPAIPAGTKLIVLSNAMFETQEQVLPSLVVPQPSIVFAQKRGMNSIVSDYFEAQAKRTPFGKALIAEAQIRDFKVKGNRTLWGGRAGKLVIETELGQQTIYTTEGIRWSIKRHLDHKGKWTFEQLIALAKMIYTGNDVPKSVIALAGKNFIENIQCIDFSKHPEVQINVTTNKLGWKVTSIHTVFGDIELKHESALDYMGWSNSAAILAPDRLVHYVYSAEHKKGEKVEGHEAKREAILVWDALALKGNCHIWVDGEGQEVAEGSTSYVMWDKATAPGSPVKSTVYVLTADCAGINANAVAGQMWQWDGTSWKEFSGLVVG